MLAFGGRGKLLREAIRGADGREPVFPEFGKREFIEP
jgi:hypothetical protein